MAGGPRGYKSERDYREKYEHALFDRLFFTPGAPLIFVSAVSGYEVDRMLNAAVQLNRTLDKKLPTAKSNQRPDPPDRADAAAVDRRRRFRIYYATRRATARFRIRLFCNREEKLTESYRRYLEAGLVEAFGLNGCPFTFELVGKPKEDSCAVSASARVGRKLGPPDRLCAWSFSVFGAYRGVAAFRWSGLRSRGRGQTITLRFFFGRAVHPAGPREPDGAWPYRAECDQVLGPRTRGCRCFSPQNRARADAAQNWKALGRDTGARHGLRPYPEARSFSRFPDSGHAELACFAPATGCRGLRRFRPPSPPGERETGDVAHADCAPAMDAGPVAERERVAIGAARYRGADREANFAAACVPLFARTLPRLRGGVLDFRGSGRSAGATILPPARRRRTGSWIFTRPPRDARGPDQRAVPLARRARWSLDRKRG